MTIEPLPSTRDLGRPAGPHVTGFGPLPPVGVPREPEPRVRYPVGDGPIPLPVVHPVPVTTDTDDHTPAKVTNAKPWEPQQHAAYARMAAQLISALHVYQQETADAGRLTTVPARLAARVRAELESAAWAAWQAKMNLAMAYAPSIISHELPDRERALTGSYQAMMASVADAWTEWNRWMELAEVASESILGPAQQAYDHRMEQAYLTMMAANGDAENSWRRMYNGAERAGTLLTSFDSRAGNPPPA